MARTKKDTQVMEQFFQKFGSELLTSRESNSWMKWFALPHIRYPERNSEFEAFFNKKWTLNVQISLKNFISTALKSAPKPKLLAFERLRNERIQMQQQIQLLHSRLYDADFIIRSLQEQFQQHLHMVGKANTSKRTKTNTFFLCV